MGSPLVALPRSRPIAARRRLLPAGSVALALACAAPAAFADAPLPADGDSGQPVYTFRLSVLNAGQPAGTGLADDKVAQLTADIADPFNDNSPNLSRDGWTFVGGELAEGETPAADRGRAVAGDFNGDGRSETAIFKAGQWFIDLNGNGAWDRDDLYARLGGANDQPIVGDWDGDGKTDIGVFGADDNASQAVVPEAGLPDAENAAPHAAHTAAQAQANRAVRLSKRGADGAWRADPVEHLIVVGPGGGTAVAGDFNGDGIDTVALFRDGRWWIDIDGDGRLSEADIEPEFGQAGDIAIAGDFDGDGVDDFGVYRGGRWLIHTDRSAEPDQAVVIDLGGKTFSPVVGDWDGDGTDDAAVVPNG